MDSDRSVPIKKPKFDLFFFLGISYLLIMAFLIAVPTKTITENISVPYLDKETYYVQEPYDVQESYQDSQYTTQTHDAGVGLYWSQLATGSTCSKYKWGYDKNGNWANLCIQYTGSSLTSVTKYRTVTKYKDVAKTRDITKTKIEPRSAEVNWILGFKTPYTLHFPLT
jgi:hypothetical protein